MLCFLQLKSKELQETSEAWRMGEPQLVYKDGNATLRVSFVLRDSRSLSIRTVMQHCVFLLCHIQVQWWNFEILFLQYCKTRIFFRAFYFTTLSNLWKSWVANTCHRFWILLMRKICDCEHLTLLLRLALRAQILIVDYFKMMMFSGVKIFFALECLPILYV